LKGGKRVRNRGGTDEKRKSERRRNSATKSFGEGEEKRPTLVPGPKNHGLKRERRKVLDSTEKTPKRGGEKQWGSSVVLQVGRRIRTRESEGWGDPGSKGGRRKDWGGNGCKVYLLGVKGRGGGTPTQKLKR